MFGNVKIKDAQREIFLKDGFRVRFVLPDGNLAREELGGLPRYRRLFTARDDMSVTEWKAVRFAEIYPGFDVRVYDGNGSAVLGQVKLSDLRGGYVKRK
ncbi:MAG: hypothetical protein LBC65_01205 [Oscillospiraceae bacterium]|nr:hypothetical protein [Oscillospiraceae bacterium]